MPTCESVGNLHHAGIGVVDDIWITIDFQIIVNLYLELFCVVVKKCWDILYQ